MKNKYVLSFFVLIHFFSQICFAQIEISGRIANKTDNEPIPYANIWISGTNIGTTSSNVGLFSITIDSLYLDKSLIISSIGFRDTVIQIKENQLTISLTPKTYEISEIIVSPRKKQIKIVNDLSETKINGGIMNDTTPQIVGLYFPYKPEYSEFQCIKSVIIYSRDLKKGKFNLRVYSFDTINCKPIEELVHRNIIVESKTSIFGKAKPVEVNLDSFNIIFPQSGLFVGAEWLIIPENRYKVSFNYPDEKKKVIRTLYAPNLAATIDSVGFMYMYNKGVWWCPCNSHIIQGIKRVNNLSVILLS